MHIIAGIIYIIVGILLWVGNISIDHALAIFIGIIGIGLLVWFAYPSAYAMRRTVNR